MKNVNKNNASHAVLFEALALVSLPFKVAFQLVKFVNLYIRSSWSNVQCINNTQVTYVFLGITNLWLMR